MPTRIKLLINQSKERNFAILTDPDGSHKITMLKKNSMVLIHYSGFFNFNLLFLNKGNNFLVYFMHTHLVLAERKFSR